MDTLQSVWVQELYSEIKYKKKETMFHSFEGDTSVIGLSFMDAYEANRFHQKVHERIYKRRTRTAVQQFQAPGKTATRRTIAGPNAERHITAKPFDTSNEGGSSLNILPGKSGSLKYVPSLKRFR